MKVTIAPCAAAKISSKFVSPSPLLRIAEEVYEDCEHDVTVEVLDDAGQCEAVLGAAVNDDIELF